MIHGGLWTLDFGLWTFWTLDFGLWTLDFGLQYSEREYSERTDRDTDQIRDPRSDLWDVGMLN